MPHRSFMLNYPADRNGDLKQVKRAGFGLAQ
jgi:hypothetical protein